MQHQIYTPLPRTPPRLSVFLAMLQASGQREQYVCEASAAVSSGHEVVRPNGVPQLSHNPDPAAHPQAYSSSHTHTAVPGYVEMLSASLG